MQERVAGLRPGFLFCTEVTRVLRFLHSKPLPHAPTKLQRRQLRRQARLPCRLLHQGQVRGGRPRSLLRQRQTLHRQRQLPTRQPAARELAVSYRARRISSKLGLAWNPPPRPSDLQIEKQNQLARTRDGRNQIGDKTRWGEVAVSGVPAVRH